MDVTSDMHGNELRVGTKINVAAVVTDIADVNGEAMLSAVTAIGHGTDGKVYSLPVLHGSQVTKQG